MEAMADIRPDDEFAVALDDVVPSAPRIKLRLLHWRRNDRSSSHSRRVNWNGACAPTAYEKNSAGET
jgi:hypothetical protein